MLLERFLATGTGSYGKPTSFAKYIQILFDGKIFFIFQNLTTLRYKIQ
jgi:hypothetical protein